MALPGWVKWMLKYRSLIFLIVYPILLSPLVIFHNTSEAKGAYALLLMAGYWITECIPIYVTALLPIIMAPLMGLLSSNNTCIEYMRDSCMLFIGGAFLAVATEHRNLHRRIGLAVMKIMGGDPRINALMITSFSSVHIGHLNAEMDKPFFFISWAIWLMLGLMLPTWFLSMWMSNAAATIMMLTIVEALVSRLEAVKPEEEVGLTAKSGKAKDGNTQDGAWITGDLQSSESGVPAVQIEGQNATTVDKRSAHNEELRKLASGLSLGIAFASSCGGMGTVIGTPTNVVFYGMVTEKFFKRRGHDKARDEAFKAILEEEKRSLGPVKWAEGTCMTVLAFVVLLWISREPGAPGWSKFMPKVMRNGKLTPLVTDTQPAIIGTVLFLVLPAYNPFAKKIRDGTPADPEETVLPWKVAASKCPWSVLILLGGGFALSKICSVSGLSTLVGENMIALKSLPVIALVYVITIIGSAITTFVANAATATVLLPIMFQLAETLHVHPFSLGLPVTIAASLAFILPAATPANAIVFGRGRVKMNEMWFARLSGRPAGYRLLFVHVRHTSVRPQHISRLGA
ncbi:unnamed protein product [Dibothriocephalus latus]|uniref:Citrate transporter-like domain-containing protein n=1 Tax=Dibothriocephalus latus TaxID=60516 RepID=A0A3P6TBG5_DIBLA|nr:unnamed protein product [Dibothriocephalus latus]